MFHCQGQDLCWPAFSSTSLPGGEFEGDGDREYNVLIRIDCAKMKDPEPGEYYPALIEEFSVYKDEKEV